MNHATEGFANDMWGAVESLSYDIVGFLDKPTLPQAPALWSDSLGKQTVAIIPSTESLNFWKKNEDQNLDDPVRAKILVEPVTIVQTQAPKPILKSPLTTPPHDLIVATAKDITSLESINASFESVQERELAREQARKQERLEAKERLRVRALLRMASYPTSNLTILSVTDGDVGHTITRSASVQLESGDHEPHPLRKSSSSSSSSSPSKSVQWDPLLGEIGY